MWLSFRIVLRVIYILVISRNVVPSYFSKPCITWELSLAHWFIIDGDSKIPVNSCYVAEFVAYSKLRSHTRYLKAQLHRGQHGRAVIVHCPVGKTVTDKSESIWFSRPIGWMKMILLNDIDKNSSRIFTAIGVVVTLNRFSLCHCHCHSWWL